MTVLTWLLRGVLFVVLFGLAIKNDQAVALHFYLGHSWQVPLSLIVLGAFAVGALFGLTATLTVLARQWRELGRMKRSQRDS